MSVPEEDWEHEPPDQGELDFGFAIGQLNINVESGGQVTIIVGSGTMRVTQENRIVQGDWNSLSHSLHQQGLSARDVEELHEALAADHDQLGEATQGWLGRIASKVAAGTLDVAVDVVVKLLRAFVGI